MQEKIRANLRVEETVRKHVTFYVPAIFLMFAQLLALGSVASSAEYDEQTLLTYSALRSGNLPAFQKLVRTTEDASQSSIKGAPLLYWAIEHKKPQHLAYLLSFGDGKTLSGLTDAQLISAATINGFLEGIKLLVEAGADLKGDTKYGTSLALIEATVKDEKEIVKYVVAQGVDLDGRTPGGQSALYMALLLKREEMTRLLVKLGASTTAELEDGDTLEDYARKLGVAEWIGAPATKVVPDQVVQSKPRKYGQSPSASYVTLVTEEGQLVEARGVRVGGNNEIYDVQFLDHCRVTPSRLHSGLSDFPFTTIDKATEASEALREQVFVDGDMGLFDSDPAATNKCGARVKGCVIATPYGQRGNSVLTIGLNNHVDHPQDGSVASFEFIRCAIGNKTGGVYAVWSPSSSPDNASDDENRSGSN